MPADKISADTIARILEGGGDKVREAGAALVGGHTIKTLEPIYGLSVTGTVHPKKTLTNAAARPGDLLVLTKPLGTGITTTALKRGVASDALRKRVTAVMKRLNVAGADVAERGLVRAATDITGFGLTGHLANIVRASGVAAEVTAAAVPVLSPEVLRLIDADCVPGGTLGNLEAADDIVDWARCPPARRILLADAQTSGPLLLCVPPRHLEAVLAILHTRRTQAAAIIGQIFRGRPAIRIV